MSSHLHHTFSEKHREEVYSQLASQIGGKFTNPKGWRDDKVQATSGPWTITLDLCGEPGYRMEQHFTRFRAPFVNADGFRFHLRPAHLSDRVSKLLGMQDIVIGDKPVDDAYIIQANRPEQIKRLLANTVLRTCLRELLEVDLSVRDHEGDLGPLFPPGVDELQMRFPGVVDDAKKLRLAFDFFAETLRTLTHIGSAYGEDPHLKL